MEKKCMKCGRVMADDECGDEFPEERVCDECAGITPEVEQVQVQSWSRADGWHDVLEGPGQVYGKCGKCGKSMTELEASESEMGAEFDDDLVCDECFEKVTLEIAKGAFPSVFSDKAAQGAVHFGANGGL